MSNDYDWIFKQSYMTRIYESKVLNKEPKKLNLHEEFKKFCFALIFLPRLDGWIPERSS